MAKMMINENTREEVIDAIAEWMADNTEFSADFLREHGEDWLHVYTLDEMYRDYCGGDLADVINMFADNNVEASTWSDYFVDDNGDLHTDDEFSEVVSEMVFDDNKYAEWVLEEIEEGLIDEPQELMDIVSKYAATPWEDVERKLWERRDDVILHYIGEIDKILMNGDKSTDDFVGICNTVHDMVSMVNVLTTTRFFGIDESEYAELCELFEKTDDITCNEVYNMLIIVGSWACGGVTIEKATEMYVKNWR